MLPNIVKAFNLSVDGFGYFGKVSNIELPTIKKKTEEYRSGGMFAPVHIDLGLEALEMSFETVEQTKNLLIQLKNQRVDGAIFRFNASAESDISEQTNAIEIIALGRINEIELGSIKAGDLNTSKFKINLSRFTYSQNGTILVDIDILNNIYVVDGADLLEQRRINLKQ